MLASVGAAVVASEKLINARLHVVDPQARLIYPAVAAAVVAVVVVAAAVKAGQNIRESHAKIVREEG